MGNRFDVLVKDGAGHYLLVVKHQLVAKGIGLQKCAMENASPNQICISKSNLFRICDDCAKATDVGK